MATLLAQPKEDQNRIPFHLLPMVYKVKNLGVDKKKAEKLVYNVWMWCGGTMPYTAEELMRIYNCGGRYFENFVTFRIARNNPAYHSNIVHFNTIVGKSSWFRP